MSEVQPGQFYNEDLVCKTTKDKGFVYGIVVDNCDSSYEDDDANVAGKIKVAWHPNGSGSLIMSHKVTLCDRSLMVSDSVQRCAPCGNNQRGSVIDMNTLCNLRVLGTNKYIYKINSKDLISMQMWDYDLGYVSLDSWIGYIVDVTVVDVTVRFTDGARCVVHDPDSLIDVNDTRSPDAEFVITEFYPNQELRGEMCDFGDADWLVETPLHSRRSVTCRQNLKAIVTVEQVETKALDVNWNIRGNKENKEEETNVCINNKPKPPRIVEGDNLARLKKLDQFGHCQTRIGDLYYHLLNNRHEICDTVQKYKFTPVSLQEDRQFEGCGAQDCVKSTEVREDGQSGMESEEYIDIADDSSDTEVKPKPPRKQRVKQSARKYSSLPGKSKNNVKVRASKPRNKLSGKTYEAGDLVPVEVVYTYTTVDVLWQDATIETNIPSVDLCMTQLMDESDFFPGDYITDTSKSNNADEYCVVQKVDHSERTCIVQRFCMYTEGEEHTKVPKAVGSQEELSIYEIRDHEVFGGYRPSVYVIYEPLVGGSLLAGQIMKMRLDGMLDIGHPDSSLVACYPQQIIMDLADSDYESFSDTYTSDIYDEEDDWVTEDEDDDDGVTGIVKLEDELISLAEALDAIEVLTLDITAKQKISQKVRRAIHDVCHIIRSCAVDDTALEADILMLEKLASSLPKDAGSVTKLPSVENLDLPLKHKVKQLAEMLGETGSQLLENLALGDITTKRGMKKLSAALNQCLGSVNGTPKGDKLRYVESVAFTSDMKLEKGRAVKAEGAVGGTDGADCKHEAMDTEDRLTAKVEVETMDTGNVGKCANDGSTMNVKSEVTERKTDSVETKRGKKDSAKIEFVYRDKKVILTVHNTSDSRRPIAKTEVREATDGEIISSVCRSGRYGNDEQPSDAQQTCVQLCFSIAEKLIAKKVDLLKRQKEQVDNLVGDVGSEKTGKQTSSIDDRYSEVPETPELDKGSFHFLQAFEMLPEVLANHKFVNETASPVNPRMFFSAVKKELSLLKSSLPDGIYVRAFEQRLDLFSVMITGPINTPYEDGLFFFDVQLPQDYPTSPPSVHYISFTRDRLNPNLYDDGTVCVSLLGTWSGKGSEKWTPRSTLLQVLISIQGLILVSEPYYNEPGFENSKGSESSREFSKIYNESALLKHVQSMIGIIKSPPPAFEKETYYYAKLHVPKMIERIQGWIALSADQMDQSHATTAGTCDHKSACNCSTLSKSSKTSADFCSTDNTIGPDVADIKHVNKPEFPLLPLSRGLILSLRRQIIQIQVCVKALDTD